MTCFLKPCQYLGFLPMIFAFARTPALPTVAGLRVELQVFVSEALDYSTLSLPSATSQKKIHFLASINGLRPTAGGRSLA
jgi:hypothetical protein